jgi:adenylosuccinate synthase
MLRQAVRLNSLTEIALTKLDVLDGFDLIKVCTAYEVDGAPVRNYPDRAEVLAHVTPVYAELPGWGRDLSGVREPGDLPAEARALLSLVEQEVGVPINVIGVGAERDDYLHWAAL